MQRALSAAGVEVWVANARHVKVCPSFVAPPRLEELRRLTRLAGVKGNARKKIPALLDALGCGLDDGAKPLVALLRDMQAVGHPVRRVEHVADQQAAPPVGAEHRRPRVGVPEEEAASTVRRA